MKKNNLLYILFIVFLTVFTFACSTDDDENDGEMVNPIENTLMPITDWYATENDIKEKQSSDFILSSSYNNVCFYEHSSDDNITISYMFGNDKTLTASCVTIEKDNNTDKKLSRLLIGFNKLGTKDEANIFYNKKKGIVAMLTETPDGDGHQYCSLCFAPYVPSDDDDDENQEYVDLCLSVKWAKCNIGANSPEDTGLYFAWSEITSKSEYWRENYSYCNNRANKYIFNYTNPLSEISGTKYDVATVKKGQGWRIPTYDEALELIYNCNWEQEIINGVKGAKVTGPNGKSIFIPATYCKKQAKKPSGMTKIWLSESPSKSDEEAYAINISKSRFTEPELVLEWKAWGLNIRAVKD